MIKVVVVGAGFGGTLSAILLDRLGFRVTLVDRYERFPAMFAAEQLVGPQTKVLDRLELLQKLVRHVPCIDRAESFTGSRRHVPVLTPHYGLSYRDMVQGLRAQIPPSVTFLVGRVLDVVNETNALVHLDDGSKLNADLVVLATGLNDTLARRLGANRTMISMRHSTTIGFDIHPTLPQTDRVLIHYGNGRRDRVDYLTIFPLGVNLRANLFVYRDQRDEWCRAFRADPAQSLKAAFPALGDQLGTYQIDRLEMRNSEISLSGMSPRDNVVMIGDACQSPCPAAGTGIDRLLLDVERLVVHAQRWASAGCFAAQALAEYSNDPVRAESSRKIIRYSTYRRQLTVEPGWYWAVRRQEVQLRRAVRFMIDRTTTLQPPVLASLPMSSRDRVSVP